MAKNLQKSVLGLALGNMFLMVSLKAKLKACVGKYRMTLARFPRQKDSTPCSADTRVKQLAIPAQTAPSTQHSCSGNSRPIDGPRSAQMSACMPSRQPSHTLQVCITAQALLS